MLVSLLLGGSAGEGDGLGLGGETLLLGSVLAAEEGDGTDGGGDDEAEDDGDDDAGSVEGVVEIHADVEVVGIVCASHSGVALTGGDGGGNAGVGDNAALDGLGVALGGGLDAGGEAISSRTRAARCGLGSIGLLCGLLGGGLVGSGNVHGSVSFPELASLAHVVTAAQCVL